MSRLTSDGTGQLIVAMIPTAFGILISGSLLTFGIVSIAGRGKTWKQFIWPVAAILIGGLWLTATLSSLVQEIGMLTGT